jgi:long-chain acyl-CoA synthetase
MVERTTLLDFFNRWCTAQPTPALIDARAGTETRIPAPEVARRVAGLAQGLAGLGLGRGDRVALMSWNRPEWHLVDFAVQHLGAALVPLYPTLLAPQAGQILRDSGARAVVVDNEEQLAKVQVVRGDCPALERVLLIDGAPPAGVHSLTGIAAAVGDGEAQRYLEARRAEAAPDDLITIIYTSGTTGEPKGAMLSHDNFAFDAISSSSVMPWPAGGELALAFLPLSHVLERLVDYIYFLRGVSIAYCNVPDLAEALRRIRPHLFTAVPRVYEKIHDRIHQEVAHAGGLKHAIFRAAAAEAHDSVRRGRRGLRWHLFDRLVYAKIRAAFGSRVRFSISGGAPLPVFVGEFFHGADVLVLEGYGLTETSPVISVNSVSRHRLGTVGPVIPEVEVKIAADGEVLTRGRHVMRGYWNKPDATAAVLDRDRWLATGDIGELTADGFLRITDRKKDLLVTAGGKNIAPQPIENRLKESPLVENAVLFGDRKPFVTALLVPAFEALFAWAAERGLPTGDARALLEHPDVRGLYEGIVEEVNGELARFETIKKFRLLAQPFTMDGGELTPTLKVKRRVIEERYGALLEEMYREPGEPGPHS